MSNSKARPTRLMTPHSKPYQPIETREKLQQELQDVLTLEMCTIPPYMCAAYSIKDANSVAARLIRSVMVQEMLHAMQVANLLNAIGGKPEVTGKKFCAVYPTFMPRHPVGGPFIQLQRASRDLMANTFMQIEQPYVGRRLNALREGSTYETIGQFYEAIEEGFRFCAQQGDLFIGDPALQQTASYFGGRGGRLIAVTDLKSAEKAIKQIVEQGEGGDKAAYHSFGADEPEGPPTVGTFGVNSRGQELAHYYKFQAIAAGEVELPETWPMETNFRTSHLKAQWAIGLSNLFNRSYVFMLRALELAMQRPASDGVFFSTAFPLMHSVLPPLATLLMQTPLRSNNVIDAPEVAGGKASRTLSSLLATAGPSFEVEQEWLEKPLPRMLEEMLKECEGLLNAEEPKADDTYKDYREEFNKVLRKVQEELRKVQEEPRRLPRL